jgi:hypothetical protein
VRLRPMGSISVRNPRKVEIVDDRSVGSFEHHARVFERSARVRLGRLHAQVEPARAPCGMQPCDVTLRSTSTSLARGRVSKSLTHPPTRAVDVADNYIPRCAAHARAALAGLVFPAFVEIFLSTLSSARAWRFDFLASFRAALCAFRASFKACFACSAATASFFAAAFAFSAFIRNIASFAAFPAGVGLDFINDAFTLSSDQRSGKHLEDSAAELRRLLHQPLHGGSVAPNRWARNASGLPRRFDDNTGA